MNVRLPALLLCVGAMLFGCLPQAGAQTWIGPCDYRPCPAPIDPFTRQGYALRLAVPAFRTGPAVEPAAGSEAWRQWRRGHERHPTYLIILGVAHARAGRFGDAQDAFQDAHEAGKGRRDVAAQGVSLANLGAVAAVQGRHGEARERMEQALRILTEAGGSHDAPDAPSRRMPRTAPDDTRRDEFLPAETRVTANIAPQVVLLNLGNLAAHLGLHQQADGWFTAAVVSAQKMANFVQGSGPGLREAYGELALLNRRLGRDDKAAELLQRARAAQASAAEEWAFAEAGVLLLPEATPGRRPNTGRPAESASAASGPLPGDSTTSSLMGSIGRFARALLASLEAQRGVYALRACGGPCPVSDPLNRGGFALRLAGGPGSPSLDARPGATPRAPDPARDALAANADGAAHATRGDPARASAEFQRAQSLLPAEADPRGLPVAVNLGVMAALQGRGQDASRRFEAALKGYDQIIAAGWPRMPADGGLSAIADFSNAVASFLAARDGKVMVMLNMANLAAHQGSLGEAEQLLRRALEPSLSSRCGGLVYLELAALYRTQGRSDRMEDALLKAGQAGEPAAEWRQQEVGAIVLGAVAPPLPAPVAPAPALAPPAAAGTPPAAGRTPWLRESRGPLNEGTALLNRLAAEAEEHERVGRMDEALAAQVRVALAAAASGNAEQERRAHTALQRLYAAAGATATAIFHGKQAVNAHQRIRRSLGRLDRQSRLAFLAERKPMYVLLVQLLLDRERRPEGEHVLRLLKEDEGQQFRQAPPDGARGTVPYASAEAASLRAWEQRVARWRQLEGQRQAAMEVDLSDLGALDTLARIEQAMYRELGRIDQHLTVLVPRFSTEAARCRAAAQTGPRGAQAPDPAIAECLDAVRLFTDLAADAATALRALDTESSSLRSPLSPVQRRQLHDVLKRLDEVQIWRTPDSPGWKSRLASLRQLLSDPMSNSARLRGLWRVQRDMDAVIDQWLQADVRSASGLEAASNAPGATDFRPADRQTIETGRRLVAALPTGTAAVYYLVDERRLDILVVTADGWRHQSSSTRLTELTELVGRMRAALRDPRYDVRPVAEEVYRLLVKPMEPALRAQKMLMLALDGPLRFIPFAALHDGQQWLAQRHAFSLYTTASAEAVLAKPAPSWTTAVAFGRSTATPDFPALPYVRRELDAIVDDWRLGNGGLLRGEIRMDAEFTAAALRDALRQQPPPNVLHIASHFVFRPGDSGSSFLLLGDGNRLSLEQVSGTDYRFDGIDLVTLSACETALPGDNSFGQEVEGLGTLMQAKGAASVQATLWRVDDLSTSKFMQSFYRHREGKSRVLPGEQVSRAWALQLAQLDFILGSHGTSTSRTEPPRQVPADRSGDWGTERPYVPDQARPYAHPYYWAPFILMGNWL